MNAKLLLNKVKSQLRSLEWSFQKYQQRKTPIYSKFLKNLLAEQSKAGRLLDHRGQAFRQKINKINRGKGGKYAVEFYDLTGRTILSIQTYDCINIIINNLKMKNSNILAEFILLLIMSLQGVKSLQISTDLPQLKNDTFTLKAEDPVNVTVGQDFSIGISQFDVQRVPEDFKIYEISQQKFINMFETLEKHSDLSVQTRKQVQKSIFNCTIKSPTMQIMKTLNVFTQKSSNKFSFASEKSMIYVPVRSRQLIYILDTATMEISVYHFTLRKMNFLSSAKVNSGKNEERIAMASSSNEEYVYIFSSQGIWSVQTKTVLTNVNKLEHGLNGFNSVQNPIDKLYHGAYNYMFGLKRLNAVYLISQEQTRNNSFIMITQFQNYRLIPQDLYVDARMLYILDLHQGVFIYKILGNGEISQHDHIDWRSYGNLEIIAKQYSIFIRYLDQEEQKIVELNYNPDQHFVSLVRYYKNDQIITSISLQTVPVTSSHMNYLINQPFLFLTTDSGEIEIYPYNIDPREIKSAHNGVKMHMEGVTGLIYLYEDLYIIATSANILYVRIRIQKPHLQCVMSKSTGHIYYEIEFSSNISTCEAYEHAFKHKSSYNYNCKLVTNYMIYVDDPELSRFQKGILYGVVFLVVASFVVGLMCLIQWRNNKLSLIGRIKDEIIRFRDRHRRMQPFTEEEQDHNKNQVQFQLPEALPIPDPHH